jgi:aspartyl-tRNA(Asn)/glutamyl-tRNA(Gln) amidotransferase subunit B
MQSFPEYEIVVGLEVHARLLTRSKLFCGDSNAYGEEPNTLISPITLGHPGTLPMVNTQAIQFAIRMGLACHSEIERYNFFARKNYFYPDLPKGYQITQHTTPICKGGYISIKSGTSSRNIRLNRIHLEEDAGKSLHDIAEDSTCIDYNRAGTPLIEIVTEPDLHSGDEAYLYLTELRKIVRYLEICDGNMEEGSLRCDANISVRKKNEEKLGTRVEVKNLNSIRNVKRAIEVEALRLINILETGGTIQQQTLSFDATTGTSLPMREKEDADDYRYFPDPDLPPFDLTGEFIDSIRTGLPVLQRDRIKTYIKEWSLSEYDAGLLTEEKEFADYFEKLVSSSHSTASAEGRNRFVKAAANLMLGPVRSWLNENNKEIAQFPIEYVRLASLIELIETGRVSFTVGTTAIFNGMLSSPETDPEEIATAGNLFQESDKNLLEPVVDQVLKDFANKVIEYRKGKKGLLALFVGEVMKRTNGKADPGVTNELLLKKLKI